MGARPRAQRRQGEIDMRSVAMSVLGIETRWRRRAAAARPFVVVGPWRSESEVPALARSIVSSLGLSPEVKVEWLSGVAARPALEADLAFGLAPDQKPDPHIALLPAPDQLVGAPARRAAWVVVAQLRRALRQQGRIGSG